MRTIRRIVGLVLGGPLHAAWCTAATVSEFAWWATHSIDNLGYKLDAWVNQLNKD